MNKPYAAKSSPEVTPEGVSMKVEFIPSDGPQVNTFKQTIIGTATIEGVSMPTSEAPETKQSCVHFYTSGACIYCKSPAPESMDIEDAFGLDLQPIPTLAPEGQRADTDLERTMKTGFGSSITITLADTAEGERVVSGWDDNNVRQFAKNWVARAEARQRLADEAIAALRYTQSQA